MNIEPSKKSRKMQLRKTMRRRRDEIDSATRENWNSDINRALIEYARRSRPASIAAYLAFDGEPDLAPALQELGQNGVQLALPSIRDLPGKSVIEFHAWRAGEPLEANRYGIMEPAGTELVPVTDIDIVLLPLVAWDERGHRLGMGASFYDRLFQPFVEHDKPLRIGVAYELQKARSIPGEPWDVDLHGVLTEKGLFTFER